MGNSFSEVLFLQYFGEGVEGNRHGHAWAHMHNNWIALDVVRHKSVVKHCFVALQCDVEI